MTGGGPTVEDVRAFWERNPLYSGEAAHPAGSAEFFAAHEAMTLREHSGRPHPVHFRDVGPGRAVLDVGCGNGFWTVQLARRGAVVSACDLTEAACDLTRRRLALAGLAAEVRVGNAEDLPYADGTFDHVNCQGVIHHTPDTARCVAEFHRVLRPGGTACFSVYFRSLPLRSRALFRLVAALAGRIMILPGRGRESMFRVSDPDDFVRRYDGAANPIGRAYTRREMRRMARGRFTVLEEVRIGFPRKVLPFAMPDALHGLLSRRFGLMLVLRCRRLDAHAGAA